MGDLDRFAAECEATARNLRRIPKDLRREIGARSKEVIATPLAARVGATFTGPWARVLSTAAKPRAAADPTIVVGGARKALTGGGSPRDVVFGSQWGGGTKIVRVPARGGRKPSRGYRLRSTRQFTRNAKQTVYPTIVDELPAVLDGFAAIADDVLREV